MEEKKNFWQLSYAERESIAKERIKKAKYIVWDYVRSLSDNSFGAIDDMLEWGSTYKSHFILPVSSVCRPYKWSEFDTYTDEFYLDEEFEDRTLYPYHFFSTYDKAMAYASKIGKHTKRNDLDKPTLEDILPIVRKYDKGFEITNGVIKNNVGVSFVIDEKYNIVLKSNVYGEIIIPHIDLFEVVLNKFYIEEYYSIEQKKSDIASWAITKFKCL